MITLVLRNNRFEGSIPPELSKMQALNFLDISRNNLTGRIPKEIMSIPITISLDFSNNNLNGPLPQEIGKLKNLEAIYLFNNRLSGVIPSTIEGCEVLLSLSLSRNSFEGTIPSTMKNMMALQMFDVSHTSLSGPVPEFVSTMNLTIFDISFNNFSGELPTEGIFKDAATVDIKGNPNLCGGIPEFHLPNCILSFPIHRHHKKRSLMIALSIVIVFIFLSLIICFIARQYSKRRSKNPEPILGVNYQIKNVSYSDILRATEGFSYKNRIGVGTFGSVFKATMSFENVTTVAMKVLNLEQHGASRSFISECEALKSIRHRNLMKIISLCSSTDYQGNDFKGLIFEFMQNGNLEAWLHPYACTSRPFKSLCLFQRLNIAIDVAAALDYLHNHGSTPIVHCDLKPSNVLLDADMTARVGDFGLARILLRTNSLLSQSTSSTAGIKGSIGYIPPEYGMGGHPSVQGDVYSYGILLLEMFTGVSPRDERFTDGSSLQMYVGMAFPDKIMDIVDAKLLSEVEEAETNIADSILGCLTLVFQCGLFCSKESPKERVAIKDVTNELHMAQSKLLKS